MSQNEAARTPNHSGDAASTHGGAGNPPAVPPRDERPRPQYGEYAPEGWTWTPPVDRVAVPDAPVEPAAAGQATASGTAEGAVAATARPIDRMWSIALLVIGVFGALYNSLVLFQLPATALESAKLSASMLGVDAPTEFTPGPVAPAAIIVGIALQLALWVGALLWSRARLRAGRSAWWIPLLAGVAAFVVMLIVGMIVFSSDPLFLQSLSPARP
ncbi:hypothetical protein DCE93_03890 [Agromyces badenianii]|uniref:Uncharacterized protein n=1 Tax=Agromyces badenianii TaxID=2080742 RepID=A0A2S0WUJ4_9MICO|nr:DUF6264 family protein [Agromyces badenianii]AWB94904.1 hypothetical protein DCE93_03890 [Agromyces badenianii]